MRSVFVCESTRIQRDQCFLAICLLRVLFVFLCVGGGAVVIVVVAAAAAATLVVVVVVVIVAVVAAATNIKITQNNQTYYQYKPKVLAGRCCS